MKLRQLVMGALLTTIGVNAEEKISYSWFEINYEQRELDAFRSVHATTLDGSYAINDNFYVGADFSQIYQHSSNKVENSYKLSLGFHKAITEKTDFYAELGYRLYELRDNGGIVSTIGTRTLLSDKFELITSIGYKDYNIGEGRHYIDRLNAADEGFNFGVSALYKFNEHSSLHFGVEQKSSNISPMVGYRYSW